jgi:hypothetical protein
MKGRGTELVLSTPLRARGSLSRRPPESSPVKREESCFLGLGISKKMQKKLPFPCPVCGRKKEYPLEELFEGAVLTCPFCKLTLTLHGHMWKDVRKEIQKLKDGK